ncbi:MAG: 30S ribosomal protein S17 [Candidatus Zixiibacteriota bacterium]
MNIERTVKTDDTARTRRKTREGKVVSDKMDKTIVVQLARTLRHPLFGKTIRTSSKLYAHDEKGEANVGDRVRVMETRPLSKQKRWRLIEVLKKAE